MQRQPTTTKTGPGRRHSAGHKKASPIKSKGAPLGFVQHTNPQRAEERAAVKAMGRRQAIKAAKAANRREVL